MTRYFLSVPFQIIQSTGFLTDEFTFLDYGCGKGDDLRRICEMGVDAVGWDPYFRPDTAMQNADIVNLGFVINVIEDQAERRDTLQHAWALADKLLLVSAMLANDSQLEKFKPFNDGVVTSINTFQKYYSQDSLREYLRDTLKVNPIAMGPGVFGVFKDEALAFRHLESRYRRRTDWSRATRVKVSQEEKIQIRIEQNEELLEDYWQFSLRLGRFPFKDEYPPDELVGKVFQSRAALHSNLLHYFGEEHFDRAETQAKDDLTLIQAMSRFSGRRIFKHLPHETQREIKHFFGNISSLQEGAQQLLLSMNDTEEIESKATEFHVEEDTGYLEVGKSLTIHKARYVDLPAILRAYIGCAMQLYGEMEAIDLIKIHFHSGKVTFMGYDEFAASPLPMMRERIKVSLWRQWVQYFDYVGEFKPHPLYFKSMFIDDTFPDFKKQTSFDEKLDLYGLAPENPSFGLAKEQLDGVLRERGYEIRGYRFYQVKEG